MCLQKNTKEKKGEVEADESSLESLPERLVAFSILWREAETGLGKDSLFFFFCAINISNPYCL